MSLQTILVADDDKIVRPLVVQLLTMKYNSHAMYQAQDGQELLELFKKYGSQTNLIYTDHEMPRVEGWDAIGNIRSQGYTGPVIIASGRIDDVMDKTKEGRFTPLNGLEDKAYEHQGIPNTVFVRKAFNVATLLKVTEYLLNKARAPALA